MKKKTYYMIGNAHLDPVWMWRWQEGFAEAKATVRSALDRMKEYPDFKFVCSSASIYDWIEQSVPEMAEEIRERIKEGRWIVVGGWWVQPDCNLPSGEGFARQSLYGQRYFYEHFGVTAKVGYCVDSFGHNRMLPQILKKSGMDSYMFLRPGPGEIDLPFNLFQWEAPDGSRVVTFRFPDPYCFNFSDADQLDERLNQLGDFQNDGLDSTLCLYGVGNHGGGPTIRNIEVTNAYRNDHKETKLIFADPLEYFSSDEVKNADLPVWTDDLQHHAPGCYAAVSAIKKAIRKGETRLLAAEKYGVLANRITGISYPAQKLTEAWKNILFLHFHDIAGGCAIESSYADSLEFAGESLSIAAKAENAALQSITWKVDTRDTQKGLPIIVFNPHSWPVRMPVTVNKVFHRLTDRNGQTVPCQSVYSDTNGWCGGRSDTVFMADVPALGYTTYYIRPDDESTNDGILENDPLTLENACLKVKFDADSGQIVSLYDKHRNRECLGEPGAVPVVIDEYAHDTWSHGKNYFNKIVGTFENAEVTLLESGKVRNTIRVISHYGNSKLMQDFTLYADSDRLDVKVTVDWHEQHKMLKLVFPVAEQTVDSYYQIPYGWIKRPANGEEEPGQMWMTVQGKSCGLALLNDQKYSFSADGNRVALTVVRSPIYADHGGPRVEQSRFTDQGEQTFFYAVLPYEPMNLPDFSALTRRAEEFNTPLSLIVENNHEGVLPDEFSGIDVDADNVAVTAVKAAEDGNGTIVRIVETAGRSGKVRIRFFQHEFETDIHAFEVKTLRITERGECEEVLLTEFSKEN